MNDSSRPSILVMGTGSVGGFVGGGLAAAGADVSFVARPRMLGALRQHGLHLTDLDGRDTRLPPGVLQLHTHLPEGLQPALVLLCVKSGATAEAAGELARMLPAGTPVLSLQNGIGNAALGARVAPELVWLPGMVPYNIAELGPGRLHRGTAGQLAAQRHPVLEALLPTFERAGLPLRLYDDLAPVQWAKLLMNLNNPVNALSGLPLRAQLLDRGYRRVLAALQEEALGVLAAAGIEPAQLGPVPPARMPALLRLPTAVFRLLAARMLRIDDKARSSMADDVALGKPTEIDAICGAVVELAQSKGGQAPLAASITTLVKGLGSGAPVQSSRELLRALGLT